jgi:UDP-N-acetylmuramate--alanine ligase
MSERVALPAPPAHVHFMGIGGIGMSGLARILRAWGYRVTGTDAFPSELTAQLQGEGIDVVIGHVDTANAAAADLIVATAALRDTNPELHAAQANGVRVIKRAELLGMLANARTCVAVAGSHGKSTTSGMLVSALTALGQDPSYAVGAVVGTTGINAAPGGGPAMVVEADEYDYSFLWLRPDFAVITNVDYDHPDLFPDQATYDRAFVRFARGLKPGGALVVNRDDPGIRRIEPELRTSGARVITIGEREGSDWKVDGNTVAAPNGATISLDPQAPGRHNILNATCALAVLDAMGLGLEMSARALGSFTGVGRRFELRGEAAGIAVIDDYAHHPLEIEATIAAARERFPGRRVIAAFQPHTYSRTKALLDPFATALAGADVAVVLDVYPARETDTLGVSADDILRRMSGDKTLAGGKPVDAVSRLVGIAQPGDVVLTMGAGDVTLVGPALLDALRSHES